MNELFRKFSAQVSTIVGSAASFFIAVTIIIAWAVTGPIFHFSDTWQLIINTGTTIVTFLMVFLIQNTQNRDAKSMRLQLDELIESIQSANNVYLDLENLSDDELDRLEQHFKNMNKKLTDHRKKRTKR
jgi:low affinity Fe/Cu permease